MNKMKYYAALTMMSVSSTTYIFISKLIGKEEVKPWKEETML